MISLLWYRAFELTMRLIWLMWKYGERFGNLVGWIHKQDRTTAFTGLTNQAKRYRHTEQMMPNFETNFLYLFPSPIIRSVGFYRAIARQRTFLRPIIRPEQPFLQPEAILHTKLASATFPFHLVRQSRPEQGCCKMNVNFNRRRSTTAASYTIGSQGSDWKSLPFPSWPTVMS